MKEKEVLNKIIKQIKNTNNSSNAYILCGNDKKHLRNCAIELSKSIICAKDPMILKQIDENNYPELITITPENEIIKKEVILNVINFVQKKPVISKKSVYIIEQAQYLNAYSSNALLKTLEDPPENVVAIFTTTNLNMMLKTIVSRCQIIKINKEENKESFEEKLGLNKDEFSFLFEYFYKCEKNISYGIIYAKKLILEKYLKKEDLKKVINFFLVMYDDILKFKLLGVTCFDLEKSKISELSKSNTINKLTKKISFSLTNLNKLNYNVNMQLFFKNYLIEIGEINYDRCCGNKVFE